MDMMKSKKGIFFTYIAVVFMGLLILTVALEQEGSLRSQSFILDTRIRTMDAFASDVELDISRGVEISGYRALLGLADYASAGEYVDNVSVDFFELFNNGSLYGDSITIMVNNTFDDWLEKMQLEAAKLDIVFNLTINSQAVSHDSPFYVSVYLNVTYNVTDSKGTARWTRSVPVSARVYISGFEDPVYTIRTNGYLRSFIVVSSFSSYVSDGDTTNLQIYTNGSYYSPHEEGPSYLMRLEGDLNSSEYGIESIIYGQDLIDLDITYPEIEPNFYQSGRSMVDYVYWGYPGRTAHQIQNMSSWFRLDNESVNSHLDKYDVDDLVI
ncbi:hypothetical protein HN419_01240 [Candidatus Woesearchaeota archaeon]|jgi:hypothetical protein|nr:hypothetical protein [Candidatus Woesearchaeota archaeon]MBT3537379.1 hypothetical protein [Candidatus Woesearchaeota archaeon]MBT4697096.1 hypothetical protein [Candidatus Woesearchaeota archaeon]MBT4717585.1 hypothetical protein [Candidatus Woesearchaeota archaeon]MBT7106311.1 hypothetical protein [Candidatus Woesearchaeota archaeon]